ncbi:MAG: endonuclease/exonuclease/phosphatase family protein [Marinosulfonomonas sp.]|nr:endonuclease/exonuclease/phosphatase family protein [Marinosulfonomonas sp.]
MNGTKTLRLASYNIHKCVGLDRRRKPGRIVDVLNAIGADVIALQEADRRLGDRPAALPAAMIEAETDFRPVLSPGAHAASLGWHGNAILVRKGTATENISEITLPGTEPRGALSVAINGRLRIIATHLGLRRSDRRQQLDHILANLAGGTGDTVILGDFNEWSQRRGLEPLADDFAVHSPGRSFHAARPMAALDRIALSRQLALRDGGVIQTKRARVASDHLPVWVDIEVA